MKALKNMNLLLFVYISVALMQGCGNQVMENHSLNRNEYIKNVFEKVRVIKMDSLKRVNSFSRDNLLKVIRVYSKDSCNYVQMLLKKTNNELLTFKVNNNWVTIDSVESHYDLNAMGITKNNIIYNFDVLEKFNIYEVNTTCDYDAVFIKIDSLEFYYIYDTSYFSKHKEIDNLRNLDGNWWIRCKIRQL